MKIQGTNPITSSVQVQETEASHKVPESGTPAANPTEEMQQKLLAQEKKIDLQLAEFSFKHPLDSEAMSMLRSISDKPVSEQLNKIQEILNQLQNARPSVANLKDLREIASHLMSLPTSPKQERLLQQTQQLIDTMTPKLNLDLNAF